MSTIRFLTASSSRPSARIAFVASDLALIKLAQRPGSKVQIASFHSTPVPLEKARKRISRLQKKQGQELRARKAKEAALIKPSPVLGHKKGEEWRWEQCLLNSILVDKDVLWGVKPGSIPPPFPSEGQSSSQEVPGPLYLQFGLGSEDSRKLLFVDLPNVSATQHLLDDSLDRQVILDDFKLQDKVAGLEKDKANLLAKVLDLRNADSRGVRTENCKRISLHFGRVPNDTGSPEVQAAVLTYRIRLLHNHLQTDTRDIHNRRSLRALISNRAKQLRYLKSINQQRYYDLLPKLGLEPAAVEGELVYRIVGKGKPPLPEEIMAAA
ncbi:hypothetical protein BT69DRAFT_1221701 [Atractiella rhizophila]|nr:hypothetical protein BT69DRAFT_1221701 [Atractiella rhizophila]